MLDGTATNDFGVPYRSDAEALRCALVTARLLGCVALPLEAAIAAELRNQNAGIRREAAAALGTLPSLTESTIASLAAMLVDEHDPAAEASATLVRLKATAHPDVVAVVVSSARAAWCLTRAQAWLERRNGESS